MDIPSRFYSMQDSTFNNRGLLPNINCINRQADMEACLWKSPRKIACDTYLGVHCSRCNYEIEIADNTKKEIEFPAYMPCFPNVLCEWNIFNNHKRKKITVLEFKNNKNLNMESGNALSYKPGQIIEILWYDIATHQWSRIRESFFRFVNIGIIKIESSNITIKYFFVDCSFFDSTVKETEIIPSMAYYNEEYTLQTSGGASYFLPVLYCLLCVFVVGTFIFCLCFYVKRKRLTKSQPCYTLTYMPGINISFEDEEQCKGTRPRTCAGAHLEDKNVQLSSYISKSNTNRPRSASDELPLNIQTHDGEPLRSLVSQLAFRYRKSSVDTPVLGSEEEVFSCSSRDSAHSYYSMHSSKRNSITGSFDSIISERQ